MKTKNETPDEWMRKRFPSADARRAADEAIDKIGVHCPMAEFIDVWIAAYEKAAGKKWESP